MLAGAYDLLYHLGVTANYTGFFHTAYALSLCTEQPERLLLVTKWLYPEVAERYETSWKAVERNIHTVSCIIWQESRPQLEELAHRHLERRPRNAQMLAILTSSLLFPVTVCGLDETVALAGGENIGADGQVDEVHYGPVTDNRMPAKEAVVRARIRCPARSQPASTEPRFSPNLWTGPVAGAQTSVCPSLRRGTRSS